MEVIMNEIEAMSKINEALSGLEEEGAVERVLIWANSKFLKQSPIKSTPIVGGALIGSDVKLNQHIIAAENEIPGIAILDSSGKFKLTIRDVKAKTTNDAAIRLTLITIYAYCKLTGDSSVSSKRILKPLLEDWRVYTGNTRHIIASHRGIIRDGDSLKLDQHAKLEAETYINDALDESIQGKWSPN
jgi:hypothetical protein